MTYTEVLITPDGNEMTRMDNYGDENDNYNYREVTVVDTDTGDVLESY